MLELAAGSMNTCSDSEDEIDLSSIVIDKKHEPPPVVPPQPANAPPVSNLSNFSIGSVMSVEDLTNALASQTPAPSKLVSLDNKSEFLEAFEEYHMRNGPRKLKSLIDSSLLKVICYGLLDDDPDSVSDEKLLRFLRKGSENREELFKLMNDRIKMDKNSTSSIGRVTSLFSSLEKAMMELGLDSQATSDIQFRLTYFALHFGFIEWDELVTRGFKLLRKFICFNLPIPMLEIR